MTARELGRMLKDAGVKFLDDRGPQQGAAIAYYTALSLSPLLVVVVGIAGLAFGQEAARGEIVVQLREAIGTEAAAFIEQLVLQSASPAHGIVATTIAIVLLFVGASGVFSQLQSSLNSIWKVPGVESEGGVWSFVKERLLSFLLVCGTAFLLLVSLVVTAILAGISSRIDDWLPGMDVLARILDFVLNFALTAALFAMIFKWLPQARLAWRDVSIGAGTTAVLFSLGRFLIGLYLGRTAVGSPYGAAGAFVVLLVWIYYSAQILLFGAELTFVYAERFGSGVRTPEGNLVEQRAAATPNLAPA